MKRRKNLIKCNSGIYFDMMPTPASIWKYQNGRFFLVQFNQAAIAESNEQLFSLIGRDAAEIYQTRPDIIECLKTCLEEKKTVECEMDYRSILTGVNKHYLVKWAYIDETTVLVISQDISRRKEIETKLRETGESLFKERAHLSEVNNALREVLAQIDQEKRRFVSESSRELMARVGPFLDKMRLNEGILKPSEIDELEDNLVSVFENSVDKFDTYLNTLSEREFLVCQHIETGANSKEIAMEMNISTETVRKHRMSIRRKLKLKGKRVNLAVFLRNRNTLIPKK